jgi:glycosyltransferase involved in cell wall biosynthesis
LLPGDIKVIHKENGGLSDARNYGMSETTGEYILFVDSDDTIELDACERFVKCLKKQKVDIVVGECKEIHPHKTVFQAHTNLDEKISYTAKEYMMRAIPANEFYCPAWLNLYRKDFLMKNQLVFAVGLLHEDMEWTPKVFLKNPSVLYLKKPFYNYIIREGSITKSKNFEKHIKDSMIIYSEWKKNFSSVSDYEVRRMLNGFLAKCYVATCANYCIKKTFRLKEMDAWFLIENAVGLKQKLKSILFIVLPKMYFRLKNLKS